MVAALAAPAAQAGYWSECPPPLKYMPSVLAHGVPCENATRIIHRVFV